MSSRYVARPLSGAASRSARGQREHDKSPNGQQLPPEQPASRSTTGSLHNRNASSARRDTKERVASEKRQVTTKETIISKVKSLEREKPTSSRGSKLSEAPPSPPQMSWNPHVSLNPHTSAPLASRASIPPLVSQAPQILQPRPLRELPFDIQEAFILEDVLLVLMGYEGQYINFPKSYNPSLEKDRLAGPSYSISSGLDPSLHDLTTGILKVASYYSAIEAFVNVQSRSEFGLVNHALCAAIRTMLSDYLALIKQLETQFLTDSAFTLHVLNVHLLSTTSTMFQLYLLTREILKRNSMLNEVKGSDDGFDNDEDIITSLREHGVTRRQEYCTGGSVLALITDRLELMSGDPAAHSILKSLLQQSSRPYMVMLNKWLHRGVVEDPYDEFMIKEQKSIRKEKLMDDYTDDYWDRRYTLRGAIPPQLEIVKDKVLLAGKYLNVVRECKGVDAKPVTNSPLYFEHINFLDNVNSAYAHANQTLLQMLLTTYDLPLRLRSIKHYFILDQSDFFASFLELGASELRKPVDKVNTGKLQSLLDLVLRQPGSPAAQDPFKEDVKVEMNQVSLMDSLTRVVNISGEQSETLVLPVNHSGDEKLPLGYSSLQLDYLVPFPTSLVISRKTIWRYQALFRHLLSLRHLEQQLSASWQTQNKASCWSHKSSNAELEVWKRRVFTLRARMIVFVQQLLSFCTSEVIERNWQALMLKIIPGEDAKPSTQSPIRTVDELMQDHVDFLDTCLKECMLTNGRLLKRYSKMMQTCALFASYTSWLSRELEKTDPDFSNTERPPGMNKQLWETHISNNSKNGSKEIDGGQAEKMRETLKKFEFNFGNHLQHLLDEINHIAATETVVLLGLCARLSTINQGTEFSGLRTNEREDS